MEISATTLALISTGSTLLGVIVTLFFNLRTARLTKESEERKHQKELVFKAAIENWKQTAELNRQARRPGRLMPLDVFLVHMVALSDLLFDPKLSPDMLKTRMAEIEKLTLAMESTVKDPYKELDS